MQTDPEFATSFGAAAAKMGAGASVPEVPDVPEEPSLVMEADESPFSINLSSRLANQLHQSVSGGGNGSGAVDTETLQRVARESFQKGRRVGRREREAEIEVERRGSPHQTPDELLALEKREADALAERLGIARESLFEASDMPAGNLDEVFKARQEVHQCYRENPQTPLNCGELVKNFSSAVQLASRVAVLSS